jgi:hypothetical protein
MGLALPNPDDRGMEYSGAVGLPVLGRDPEPPANDVIDNMNSF